jgi:hypothetical protein
VKQYDAASVQRTDEPQLENNPPKSKRGGARPGGGRPKGVPNKVTLVREAMIAESGLTPLQFMLNKLRDDQASDEDRKWAAQNAAPYVHPKLSSIEANLKGTIDVRSTLLDMD